MVARSVHVLRRLPFSPIPTPCYNSAQTGRFCRTANLTPPLTDAMLVWLMHHFAPFLQRLEDAASGDSRVFLTAHRAGGYDFVYRGLALRTNGHSLVEVAISRADQECF